MAKVALKDKNFIVRTEVFEGDRGRNAPDRRWNPSDKWWVLPVNRPNAQYLNRHFSATEIMENATKQIRATLEPPKIEKLPFPNCEFKTQPMAHQKIALDEAWSMENFALFMDMGTGKTWTAINLATERMKIGKVQALLVVCPTSIKMVWEWEIELHAGIPLDVHVLKSGRNPESWMLTRKVGDHGVVPKVLVVGIEALSQGKAYQYTEDFAKTFTCMMVIDESSKIKNAKAMRSQRCIELGLLSKYRMIMTGTPITQGIQDIYSQFRFLDWEILGIKSYFAFRDTYCIMGGFEGKSITGYKNVADLVEQVKPYIYQVRKQDALDLPDKVYEERLIEPSKQQFAAIKDLEQLMMAEDGDDVLTVKTVLERLTRYQQILGGNFPYEEGQGYGTKPITGPNPKMEALKDVIEESGGQKMVIWARFKPEIGLIMEYLKSEYPGEAVQFHGSIPMEDRKAGVALFQEDEETKFFVTNQQTGSVGLTLTAGTLVVYFSNSFSYEDRIQSENRCHRKGQTNKVTYVDLVANHKADRMITRALVKKQSMAEYVQGELADKKEIL